MFRLSEEQEYYIHKALRWIYPKRCPVCNKIIPLNEDYCICSRYDNIKISKDFCYHCGHENTSCVCNAKNSIILPYVSGVYIYKGKIRADILSFKFKNEKYLAEKLGRMMAERCANVYCDIDFDIVTYIPMTEKSLDKRLYNQSQLLAQQVSELMFVPVEGLFIKIRDTHSQHTLGGEERVKNLKNSIILRSGVDIKDKNILICDDVKTTGATFEECVRVLKDNGAAKVCCICVAVSDFSI